MSLSKKNRRAARYLERKYDLSKFKGELIDITQFPEYSYLSGNDVYVKINNAGKITEMKQISPSEINRMREEKEEEKILEEIRLKEKKTSIQARIDRERQSKELKTTAGQEKIYNKLKGELRAAYAELLRAGYLPGSGITELDNLKYLDKYDKVVKLEDKFIRMANTLNSMSSKNYNADALEEISSLFQNDANIGPDARQTQMQLQKEKLLKEQEEGIRLQEEQRVQAEDAALQESQKFTMSRPGELPQFPQNVPMQNNNDLRLGKDGFIRGRIEPIRVNQSQQLPDVLQQPKKSTQDADRRKKKKIEDDELDELLR
tara:strand:- start:3000 stop:3950 length:951 start_codon:yes stop_codon:yes gene_type:complete